MYLIYSWPVGGGIAYWLAIQFGKSLNIFS